MISSLRQKAVLAAVMASAFPGISLVVAAQTTSPAATPASPSPPVDASHSTLRIIATEAPNATQWALAPLSETPPPDIRQNLTMLKEDIADEAKVRPVGTTAAYQAAYRLCGELIAALDERTLAQVRAGYRTVQIDNSPLVTSQALEARRNYMMSWPQYAREQDQRAAIEHKAETNGNVAKEGLKVQWVERTIALRPIFDRLYADLRAALRATPAVLEPVSNGVAVAAGTPSIPTPGIASRPSAQDHLVTTNPAPSQDSQSLPPSRDPSTDVAPRRRYHTAELKDPQVVVLLNRTKNTVVQGADWNSLTPEELELVKSLKFGEIGFPEDREQYSWFKLFVMVDNSHNDIPPGQLIADTRILCADAQGNLSVAKMSDNIDIPKRGRHLVALCNNPGNDDIKGRNNGDPHPRNAYVEFRVNDKVFRQVLLSSYGPDEWWTKDELVPARF